MVTCPSCFDWKTAKKRVGGGEKNKQTNQSVKQNQTHIQSPSPSQARTEASYETSRFQIYPPDYLVYKNVPLQSFKLDFNVPESKIGGRIVYI